MENRKKGYTWKGAGKAALVGGVTGLYGGGMYKALKGVRLTTKMISMGSYNAKADAIKRASRKEKITLRSTAKAYVVGGLTGGSAIGGRLWRGKKYPVKAVTKYAKATKKMIFNNKKRR